VSLGVYSATGEKEGEAVRRGAGDTVEVLGVYLVANLGGEAEE